MATAPGRGAEWQVFGRSITFSGRVITEQTAVQLAALLRDGAAFAVNLSGAGLWDNDNASATKLVEALTTGAPLASLRIGPSKGKRLWQELLPKVIAASHHLRDLTLCGKRWFDESAVDLANSVCGQPSLDHVTLHGWDGADVLTFLDAVPLQRQGLQRLSFTGIPMTGLGATSFQENLDVIGRRCGLQIETLQHAGRACHGAMVSMEANSYEEIIERHRIDPSLQELQHRLPEIGKPDENKNLPSLSSLGLLGLEKRPAKRGRD